MRTLIIGDVHGCSVELERLVARARPTRIILAGDLFTKGPDPGGVWRLIQRHEMESVLGNTDLKAMRAWREKGPLPKSAITWLKGLPWRIKGKGFVVVHAGVDPVKGWRGTTREQAMTIARWPNNRPQHPNWWELYRRKRLVVHGHHARNGLLDFRPYTLGLDTGCVYGGRLTGYLVEDDRLLSVRAQQAWFAD